MKAEKWSVCLFLALLIVFPLLEFEQVSHVAYASPQIEDDCASMHSSGAVEHTAKSNPVSKKTDVKLNAVFEGGGVRGIGLVGALKRVEEAGIKFEAVGGTSAGSVVAALYAAGYSVDEIEKALNDTDFSALLDPYPFPLYGMWQHYGLHKGDKLYEWIYLLLKEKGVETFEDLKSIDLKIVASDLTNKDVLVFSKVDHKKLRIAEAVRMSSAIPIFFKAQHWGETLVVDGGIISNYPLWLFDDSSRETLGFKLVSGATSKAPRSPGSLTEYLAALLGTMTEAHDKADERAKGFQNTIHISTCGVESTAFGLTKEQKKQLFHSGYSAAARFLGSSNVEILTGRQ